MKASNGRKTSEGCLQSKFEVFYSRCLAWGCCPSRAGTLSQATATTTTTKYLRDILASSYSYSCNPY